MRVILTLVFALLSISVSAQSGVISKQTKINRTYEELSAAYTVVAADASETVYCKFSNEGTRAALVVLSITKAGGGTSHRQVEVPAGSMASINIGDIASASVSITYLNQGEDSQDRSIAERADHRDQLTKEDGKLSAMAFAKNAPKHGPSPGKIDTSEQSRKIIEIIFGSGSTASWTITDEDNAIAQYFLRELVQGSCQMSLAKVLFDTTYNFDPDVLDIALDLIEAYGENCGKGAKKGEYYKTVIVTIRAKYHGPFENRKQNGEWLMTIE